MNKKLLLRAVIYLSALQAPARCTIRIVCTAALTTNHAEFRKKQYIETFSLLAQYGYTNPFIVEAIKKAGPTYLEDFSSNVFYATTNDPTFKNNGINEAATFLECLHYFNFDDEDMIIKFTGRHQLTSDFFLRLVENNPEYDAFVKVNSDGNVYTLGMAMKCKYFKEMLERLDFKKMGYTMRPFEYDVGDYIKWKKKQGNFRVYYVDKLEMKAQLFGSSTFPGIAAQEKYY